MPARPARSVACWRSPKTIRSFDRTSTSSGSRTSWPDRKTVSRWSVGGTRYNDAVRDYNTQVRQFPNNLMAGMFGFEGREYFEADEAAQQVPTVQF